MATPVDLYSGGSIQDVYETCKDMVLFSTALTDELKYPWQALMGQRLLEQVQELFDAAISGDDNMKLPFRKMAAIIDEYDEDMERYLEDPSSAADYIGVEEGKTLEGFATAYQQLKNFVENVKDDPLEFVREFLDEKFETAAMPETIPPLPRRALEYMLPGLKEIRDPEKMHVHLLSCMLVLGGAGPAEKYFAERRGEIPVPSGMEDPVRHLLDGDSPDAYREKYNDMIAVPGIQETLAVLVRAIDCTPEANVSPDPTFQNVLLGPDSYSPGLVALRSLEYVAEGIKSAIKDVNSRRDVWDVVRTMMWPAMELLGFGQAPFFLSGETMEAPGLADLVGEAVPVPAAVPTPAKGENPTLSPGRPSVVPGGIPAAPAASRIGDEIEDEQTSLPADGGPVIGGGLWLLGLPGRFVRYLGLSRQTTNTAIKAAIVATVVAAAVVYRASWTMPFELIGASKEATLFINSGWIQDEYPDTFQVSEWTFILAHLALFFVDAVAALASHAFWAKGDRRESDNLRLTQTQARQLEEAQNNARKARAAYDARTETTPSVAREIGRNFQDVVENSSAAQYFDMATRASLKGAGISVKDGEGVQEGLLRTFIQRVSPRAAGWLARKGVGLTPGRRTVYGLVFGGLATGGANILAQYGKYVVEDIIGEYAAVGLVGFIAVAGIAEVVERIFIKSRADSTRGRGWFYFNIMASTMIRTLNLVFVLAIAANEFTTFPKTGAKTIAGDAYMGYADWYRLTAGAQVGFTAMNVLNATGSAFIYKEVRDNPEPVSTADPSAVLERLEQQRNEIVRIRNEVLDDDGNPRRGITGQDVTRALQDARDVLLQMENLAASSDEAENEGGGSSSAPRSRREYLTQASDNIQELTAATTTANVLEAQGSTVGDTGKDPFQLASELIAEANELFQNAPGKNKPAIQETIDAMERARGKMEEPNTSARQIRRLARSIQGSLDRLRRKYP